MFFHMIQMYLDASFGCRSNFEWKKIKKIKNKANTFSFQAINEWALLEVLLTLKLIIANKFSL